MVDWIPGVGVIVVKWTKNLLSKLVSYVCRSASEARRWFSAGKTFWIWLAVTIAILLTFYFLVPGELPDRVRWAGALFEFMGISAVVVGINRARRSFGKPSVLRGTYLWLREFRFIFLQRPPVHLTARTMLGLMSTVATAAVVKKTPESMEERVAKLEEKVAEFQTNLRNVDQKIDKQKREVQAAIDAEIAARREADQGVNKRLEESMIGDNSLELAGVAYLYMGLLMVHLSAEVAAGLGHLGLV